MTLSEQYDEKKQETADYFTEADAVDEVLFDLKLIRKTPALDEEELEALIEQIAEYVHYDESLEYILRQIPNKVKRLLV